jgi:hypothetical protein
MSLRLMGFLLTESRRVEKTSQGDKSRRQVKETSQGDKSRRQVKETSQGDVPLAQPAAALRMPQQNETRL